MYRSVGNRTRLPTSIADMIGVDLTAIPAVGPKAALLIASEIGSHLSAFPAIQHFCSWLGLAPGTRISVDVKLRSNKRNPVNTAEQARKLAAMTARRSENCIGARHRARLARLDPTAAIEATAHELIRLIFTMLIGGEDSDFRTFDNNLDVRARLQRCVQ